MNEVFPVLISFIGSEASSQGVVLATRAEIEAIQNVSVMADSDYIAAESFSPGIAIHDFTKTGTLEMWKEVTIDVLKKFDVSIQDKTSVERFLASLESWNNSIKLPEFPRQLWRNEKGDPCNTSTYCRDTLISFIRFLAEPRRLDQFKH